MEIMENKTRKRQLNLQKYMLSQIKGQVIKPGRIWELDKIKMFHVSSMKMLLRIYNLYANKH